MNRVDYKTMTTIMQANIKKQLAEKNMTAAELERRTGIPHAVINILHGRSKNPSIRTAQAIAKELGCSVEELLQENPGIINSNQENQQPWNAELYKQVANTVCECIEELQLKPAPVLVSKAITEVYNYTLGGPQKIIDHRFVQWLIKRNFLD